MRPVVLAIALAYYPMPRTVDQCAAVFCREYCALLDKCYGHRPACVSECKRDLTFETVAACEEARALLKTMTCDDLPGVAATPEGRNAGSSGPRRRGLRAIARKATQ